jgi:predicted transposase/invertase (TIGR01784 family)
MLLSDNNSTIKEKFVNPFTDFGFKKLFGSEPNKDLLIDFLNELLKTKEIIKDLTYKKTEHLGSTDTDRKAIFDLYCENERGEKFIVELQKVKQQFFKDRSLYYATFPIQEQAQKGDWNYELKSVYCVGILDFVFDDKDKDQLVVDEIGLISKKSGKVFNDKLSFVYVQMPNFTQTEDELESHLDKWLFLLKNLPKFDRIPSKLQEKIFKKVFKIAEIAKYSAEDRQKYLDSLKHYLDLKNSVDTARNEGEVDGRNKEKIEIAINFIKKGYTNQIIKDGTGLSDDEIDELRDKLNDKLKDK